MEVSVHVPTIATLLLVFFNIIDYVSTDLTDLDALWISDCDSPNRTKACWRDPPSCTMFPKTEDDYGDDMWCNVVVRWQQTFDKKSVNFEIYAPNTDNSEYIAIAFSSNQKMVSGRTLK